MFVLHGVLALLSFEGWVNYKEKKWVATPSESAESLRASFSLMEKAFSSVLSADLEACGWLEDQDHEFISWKTRCIVRKHERFLPPGNSSLQSSFASCTQSVIKHAQDLKW